MISRVISKPKQSFFLFGPRLTGKSTWLESILPENALKISLLNEADFQTYLKNPSHLGTELKAFQKKLPRGWVLIDEIQRLPALLNEVHLSMESGKLNFALSGSSARKLKRGGANLLASRALEKHLFPLIYPEVLQGFELDSVLRWGSLPLIFLADDEEKKLRLRSYVSTYLREEIQAEGIVRNLPSFARFLQLSGESIAQELSYTSIAKESGVTSKTIREYFQVLEDTLVGFLLPPWEKTIRKQLAGSPKFYLFDNGVTNALRENLTDRPSGAMAGALFEQWVIQQIRAILSYREIEASLYFWKARGGNEVDLIIARGNRPLMAIEIKSTQRPDAKDFSGLRSFSEEYPKVPLRLLTKQPRAAEINGMQSLPALEFIQNLWEKGI